MRLRKWLLYGGMCLTLCSCRFKCQVGNVEDDAPEANNASGPVMKNGTAVYNNIELNHNGFEVKKAYLMYNDNGERLPEGNFYEPGRKVAVVLEGVSGWKEKNGLVNGGASEIIIAGETDTLLNAPDLFAEKYPKGMDAADAKVIRFTATVGFEKDRPAVSIAVHFKIWDKSGGAALDGRVTLLTK